MELTIQDRDGLRLVQVSGELDTFAARGFREKLSHPRSSNRFVVDLCELTFVDSAGLHALFGVSRSARDVGARLVFVVPAASPIRKVIELVRLADVSPVCETVEDAIARARPDDQL
jgi:anti-anti-sigma factor